jgi:small subunit ribosomal protein S6
MTEEHVREDAHKYELMVIINPDIGMDAIKKRLDEIRKVLSTKKNGVAGEIFFEEIWGARDLAYKIKKHDRGFYAVFDFITDPTLIQEMDKTFRLEPELLRHMIVRLPGSYKPVKYAELMEKQAEEQEEKQAQKLAKKKNAASKSSVKTVKSGAKKEASKDDAPAQLEAVPEEAPNEDAKPEEAKAKEETKPKEPTLEDVDAKLKSIIDNPDINF